MTTKVVCIDGDGIGPEVARAMRQVVAATGADIEWVPCAAGLAAFKTHGAVMPAETLAAIEQHRLAIKGPTNTPKGVGHSSVNVQLRKHFDLYTGYRPYASLPFPISTHKNVDMLLFRQNTEGLYACEETDIVTPNGKKGVTMVAHFTEEAMTRLATRAFSVAAQQGRKTVTLVTKSNILKGWGKLYYDAFMAVAANHPDIVADEMLVDAEAMRLTIDPSKTEVIVTENMFGDILSDLCAGLIGGLGVAPGANIGDDCAIFESVHGSADDIAGKDMANPTALILSASMLLEHLNFDREAVMIRTAVDHVLQCGTHVTGDLWRHYRQGTKFVGTKTYTEALCEEIAANG